MKIPRAFQGVVIVVSLTMLLEGFVIFFYRDSAHLSSVILAHIAGALCVVAVAVVLDYRSKFRRTGQQRSIIRT